MCLSCCRHRHLIKQGEVMQKINELLPDLKFFKVVIAGTRKFINYNLLCDRIDAALTEKAKTHKIIVASGTARGADTLGEAYAFSRGYGIKCFPAQWDKHPGKTAGMVRNREMAEWADAAFIFWDGTSPGTKNMIEHCRELNIPRRIIVYDMNSQKLVDYLRE